MVCVPTWLLLVLHGSMRAAHLWKHLRLLECFIHSVVQMGSWWDTVPFYNIPGNVSCLGLLSLAAAGTDSMKQRTNMKRLERPRTRLRHDRSDCTVLYLQ